MDNRLINPTQPCTWRGLLLALAVLLALGACGETPAPGAAGKIITQQQQVDTLMITVDLPARIPAATEQEVVVTLTDGHGTVDGATVWLTLVMPNMVMSSNEPDAHAEGSGRYRSKVLFTMVGSWNLDVHAVLGNQEYVAHFHTQST